ncbi:MULTISPECIES: TerC family protein [Bacillus]|jgi:YjbE family integral membrane protein|uniref:Membrane protein YjbE n=1 Tax=Bacillus mojavensis TaxID=72360 RepID=A0ABX6LVD8_BACMO|nr:TerC family protein [Bacillus mojavensis]MCY9189944.1 TerC family protein [Bacillus mojavensis]QJC95685.1 putative membrane protein YjbE [Bacillus mojavensis]
MEHDYLISLLLIVGIDLILGGDNAVVIAMASRNLPDKQRQQAIILGTFIAVAMRIGLTSAAVYLLNIPFLQCTGGIFLLYLGYQLLIEKKDAQHVKSSTSLWKAIRTIVLADLFMSLDNVIAVAGASHGELSLVMIGLCVSVPVIIWGSKLIHIALEKIPLLIYVGSGLLAYTGGEMIVRDQKLSFFMAQHGTVEALLPILTVVFVILASIYYQQVEK